MMLLKEPVCYSSTQILLRDFAMPLDKSEHYEYLGIYWVGNVLFWDYFGRSDWG